MIITIIKLLLLYLPTAKKNGHIRARWLHAIRANTIFHVQPVSLKKVIPCGAIFCIFFYRREVIKRLLVLTNGFIFYLSSELLSGIGEKKIASVRAADDHSASGGLMFVDNCGIINTCNLLF